MSVIELLQKVTIVLLMGVFLVGITTIFLKSRASFGLIGQIIAVKSVSAASFFLSQTIEKGSGNLLMLSVVTAALVPSLALVGLVVLHRSGRFSGTLDYEKEKNLNG